MAARRHQAMMLRLKKRGLWAEYQAVFDDWESKGIIEPIPVSELTNFGCYLPHRPVIKEDSSTFKIRPVFDASAKTPGEVSLNDCLEKGGNLIEEIPGIIDRFRKSAVGAVADVEKAFLQLAVNPEHRDFLRFFNPNGREYRHCRVVFGVTSSPFLLGAVLRHHFTEMKAEYSTTVELMERSFYVDNLVVSVDTEADLKALQRNAIALMNRAKMNLRCWATNVGRSSEDTNSSSTMVLGLTWNLARDTLACHVSKIKVDNERVYTKRQALAVTHQVFDPIGFSCPIMLRPKLLIKEMWERNLRWDEPLPEHLDKAFKKWGGQIESLGELEIPRCMGITNNCQIHIFADASQNAYAACVFVRVCEEEGVTVNLIRAKSRLAPKGNVTIPRLELLACTIAARLYKSVVEALSPLDCQPWFWTDSATALWWIRENGNWEVFVRNRVKEIRSLTDIHRWFHIPGENNPADLPSRGCSLERLKSTRWWEGPSWLKNPETEWPVGTVITSEVTEEPVIVLTAQSESIETHPFHVLMRRYNFRTATRVVSWCYRYILNRFPKFLPDRPRVANKYLRCNEIKQAEEVIWRNLQRQTFTENVNPYPLEVFEDLNGLCRARLRITARKDDKDFLAPIVLPGKHEWVERLVDTLHQENCHAGFNILWSIIRSRFWIIGARKTIKRVIRRCLVCKRLLNKTIQCSPAELPVDKIRDAAIFEISGVDLAGPLLLRSKQKVWIVLYTCAVYRAVHLDMVESLSAEAFLRSLRRFIARRGRPRTIYSDNATNFKAASEELSRKSWMKVAEEAAVRHIQWKFIPPSAPWWGGWWERLVRLMKDLLKRTLKRASLTAEELYTVLCEVEAVINSRPLTYLDEEDQLIPLTPGLFLKDLQEVGVPEVEEVSGEVLRGRVKYRRKLLAGLRKRFRDEYLSQLKVENEKKSSSTPLKVGDVVLVSDHMKKRLMWPLAQVVEIFKGRDGRVRCVKVKTQKGLLIRPVQRLVPLEVSTSNQMVQGESSHKAEEARTKEPVPTLERGTISQEVPLAIRTRSGRLVRTPQRLDLFDQVIYELEESPDPSRVGVC